MIKWVSCESDSKKSETALALAYLGVKLRDRVSLFKRFEITLSQIGQLSIACQEYFKVISLLLPSSVNPSVWTLGHQVLEKYGQGLGMVTMEGQSKAYLSEQIK